MKKKYLPSAEMKEEFERFKLLKTDEEKIVFQNERITRFKSKSYSEKETYLNATQEGLNAIAKRVDELEE